MKKLILLALCTLSLLGFAACQKPASFFEKAGYGVTSNRVLGESVGKDGDLYYRYVNGVRTGEGYTSLTAANSLYSVYAYLENPNLPLYTIYLAQKQSGEWVCIADGEELLLPEGGEWSFTMPYLTGKKTQTVTAENGTEKTQTIYSIISLNALHSDLSKVQSGAIVAPFLPVIGSFDYDENDLLDGIILQGEDGISRVYDSYGTLLFENEQSVAYTQKKGVAYFKTYDAETKLYSLYAENGTLLVSGATYLIDDADYDYFVTTTQTESGATNYTVVVNGTVHPLPQGASVITAAQTYLLYAQKQGDKFAYYSFSEGKTTLLPYEIVSASSYGDAFLAWKTEASTTVDILDSTLTAVFKGLPEDVQISPLSDANSGILCFYSQTQAQQNGFPTAYFITPNGTRTLPLASGEAIRSTQLVGYYEIMALKENGAYSCTVYNVLTNQKTAAYDALSLRYENGIKYVLGISYQQNTATILDGATFAPVYTFALQNAESAQFDVVYTEEFLIAQTAQDNAMPLTAISLTEGEITRYYALYRTAAYGENFHSAPLILTEIADEPQFSAANNLLIVGQENSTVYRVTPGGLTQIFAENRTITGAFTVGKTLYYLYQEGEKTGVINAQNKVVIPAEYDGVSAQVEGMLSLKQGETFVLAVVQKDGVLYPAQEPLSSLELYSDGIAVAVGESGVATLFHNGKPVTDEALLSCDLYYDITQKENTLIVKPLFVFTYEYDVKFFCGATLTPAPTPICSIGSFGDEMPSPVYYLTYVLAGETLKVDRVEPTHYDYALSAPAQGGLLAYFFFDEACTQIATTTKVFSGEYGTNVMLYVSYTGVAQ